jgi:hypothetical protein
VLGSGIDTKFEDDIVRDAKNETTTRPQNERNAPRVSIGAARITYDTSKKVSESENDIR